jgi:predicted glycosyltransferase
VVALRFWFDILTPKQVLFFQPVIDRLKEDGHELLVTSRSYREVEQLASLVGLELTVVGSRGGRDALGQFQRSLERIEKLLPRVVDFSPEAGISVASADCARICFGLRTKHIAVNDSPHSLVAGKLSLPLSYHLITPWIIPYSAWSAFGVARGMVTRYRALDPAAWLKRRESSPRPTAGKGSILVRVEESFAPYLQGSDETWTDRVLSRIAQDFPDNDLVVLCRYQEQLAQIKERYGSSFSVPEDVVDGAALIQSSSVFVGMGGTMTTESALLGVPAISAYQGGDLYTERYLRSKGLLLKARSPAQVSKSIRLSLDTEYSRAYARKARALLAWMDDPAKMIARYLESLEGR